MAGPSNNNADLRSDLRDLQDLVSELESSERLRHQMELALLASEERFRELAETLPEIVFELDGNGTMTFVNNRALEIMGYTTADFTRGEISALEFLVPQDRDRAIVNIAKLLGGSQTGQARYTLVRKDGTTFPVIAQSTPIITKGKPAGVRGILFRRDVQEDELDSSTAFSADKALEISRSLGSIVPGFENLRRHLANVTKLLIMLDRKAPSEEIEAFRASTGIDSAITEIPELMSNCMDCMKIVIEAVGESEAETD